MISFLESLIDYSSKNIKTYALPLWNIINSIYLNRYQPIHIIYFSLYEFQQFVYFQEVIIFLQVMILVGIEFFTVFLYYILTSIGPLVMTPFSLLTFRVCVLSFYYLAQLQFTSVESHSRVQLFATPWTAAWQASLSITNSRSLFKLMSTESVMPSSHLILCHPLLLLPSMFLSIRMFSNQ